MVSQSVEMGQTETGNRVLECAASGIMLESSPLYLTLGSWAEFYQIADTLVFPWVRKDVGLFGLCIGVSYAQSEYQRARLTTHLSPQSGDRLS